MLKPCFKFIMLCLSAILLAVISCTLDNEPDIPSRASNKKTPFFASAEVIPDTNNNFQAKARLSSLGTLNILQHGWVWSETQAPTLLDSSRVFGSLTIDSFSTVIAGLDLGKPYYLRSFIATGADTIYGPEQYSFLGVDFMINTDTEIFQGAEVQFANNSAGNNTYLWNFGDGATSIEVSPLHTFNTLGTMLVRLTAENKGCIITKELVLKIIPNPFEGYWVNIPGGTFMMGCTAEQGAPDCWETPVHQVNLSPFLIGKTEITQGQWKAVLGTTPSTFDYCPECPVESISWNEIVQKFLPMVNRKTGKVYRLPSEAEWEYSARGGVDFPSMTKYAGSDSLNLVAWNHTNAGGITHPVGQKKPNGYGLYDMSGNVSEWVEDDRHDFYYTGVPTNGSAWIDNPRSIYRMYRNGSYVGGDCRVAARMKSNMGYRYSHIGFRLARSN